MDRAYLLVILATRVQARTGLWKPAGLGKVTLPRENKGRLGQGQVGISAQDENLRSMPTAASKRRAGSGCDQKAH